MLNLQKKSHKLLGSLLFRLPHNQRRWQWCMAHYRPVLENTFQDNDAARLLVMKVLRQIRADQIDGAQNTLNALRPVFNQAGNEEKALWHILHALHQMRSGHWKKMAANLKSAHKYGHRYYLAHIYHAEYYMNTRYLYPEAVEHFNKAIECLYAYPPMTERIRGIIGSAYADIAEALTMMHQFEDAKDAIRKAENMKAEPAYLLRSKALLYAAMRQPMEAKQCLSKLEGMETEQDPDFGDRIRRILAEEHPHFTAFPMGSPEQFAEYWRYFLEKEDEIQTLLRSGHLAEANDIIFSPLVAMDVYEDDYWAHGIQFKNNCYQLQLISGYSRTYTPFIDALLAACPPEIGDRWHIIRTP